MLALGEMSITTTLFGRLSIQWMPLSEIHSWTCTSRGDLWRSHLTPSTGTAFARATIPSGCAWASQNTQTPPSCAAHGLSLTWWSVPSWWMHLWLARAPTWIRQRAHLRGEIQMELLWAINNRAGWHCLVRVSWQHFAKACGQEWAVRLRTGLPGLIPLLTSQTALRQSCWEAAARRPRKCTSCPLH